jgi:predicted RNA-binding protein with PUA-like domain
MACWLFKSEPETWSWDDQVKRGRRGQAWDGVRNFQARKNMKSMKVGDRGFFYHSGATKEIVGIVEVVKEAHPDPTDESGVWECVDIAAVKALPKPVSLDVIKANRKLAGMVLARNPRLSVQPVSDAEWRIVLEMGGGR